MEPIGHSRREPPRPDRRRPFRTGLLALAASLLPAAGSRAGTTVIEVRTEGAGDVVRTAGTPATNLNGAAVWNGTEWVVNATWAHKYFVDVRTGQRLKTFATRSFSGTSPTGVLGTFGNYRVSRGLFASDKRSAANDGLFSWEGVEYEIVDVATGRSVLLRSRGVGAGASKAYFDVFVEDDTPAGQPQTTAFLGDPAWFTFPAAPRGATELGSDSRFRTGSLPGAHTTLGTTWGDYFFDIGGGADLGPAGIGKSFQLECRPLPSRVRGPSSSWITGFRLKYMDSSGNLHELRFFPALASEQFLPDAGASTPLVVPVVLALAGKNGAYFTTELTLTNRSATAATLQLRYTATSGGGSGTASLLLPPRHQTTAADAISWLRASGLPLPTTGSFLGTLRVDVAGPRPGEVALTARTTTLVPEGRAGLAYPAAPDIELFTDPVVLCGLRADTADRSNVAVVNGAASGELRLKITVASGSPSSPGRGSFETERLGPGGFRQYALEELVANAGLSLASPNVFVRIEPLEGGPFFAYGVVNDQANSDGSFVFPVREGSLWGNERLVLPVVVETASATPFSTELVLTNTSDQDRPLELTWVTTFGTTPGATVRDSLTLAPGEQRIVADFVDDLRRRAVAGVGPKGTTFAGALFVTAAGTGPLHSVVVGARTAAPGSAGGRYGLFYPALPSQDAATGAAWVYGMRQDGENRTNLALVNADPAGETIVLSVEVFRASDGERVALLQGPETTLSPGGWTQIDRILERFAPGTQSAWARVTRVSGSAPFVAYAVVNDGGQPGGRSGDGAYVPMAVE